MQEILSTFRECAILAVRTPRQPFGQPRCPFHIMLKLADLGRNAWVGFDTSNQPPAVTVWGFRVPGMGGITMKNHLKHHPYLRFVDGASAETEGMLRPRRNPAAAEDTAQQVDWEAEAREVEGTVPQNESPDEGERRKARLYDEAQEQGKSELQKAQEAAAGAEARAAAMEAEAMRAKVAAAWAWTQTFCLAHQGTS